MNTLPIYPNDPRWGPAPQPLGFPGSPESQRGGGYWQGPPLIPPGGPRYQGGPPFGPFYAPPIGPVREWPQQPPNGSVNGWPQQPPTQPRAPVANLAGDLTAGTVGLSNNMPIGAAGSIAPWMPRPQVQPRTGGAGTFGGGFTSPLASIASWMPQGGSPLSGFIR